MNPIYKFELTANGTTQQAFPIYGDGLSKDFEKESGEEFFRAKLSGELTFERDDYAFIDAQAFDEQFDLEIFISYDAGATWASYWKGTFWKTDCKFDDDAETVVVKPSVSDEYSAILAGIDKEFNLIDLAPAIVPVKADKRPMVQVYVPGQSVIGCFLSGMWWEQECTPESDEFVLSQIGDGKLNFSLNKSVLMGEISGTFSPELPDIFTGVKTGGKFNPRQLGTQEFANGDYSLVYNLTQNAEDYTVMWSIFQTSTQRYLFRYQTLVPDIGQVPLLPQTLTLTPVADSGATGNVSLYLHEMPVYSRYLCDTDAVNSVPTYTIGSDDIVPDNRNYRRVIGYYFPDTIYFSTQLSATPTPWGLYQPGQYYVQFVAPLYGIDETFPIARNAWGRVSIWFASSAIDWIVERSGRAQFEIRDSYPLFSVISVLLGAIDPNIIHDGTTAYSQFLYGTNLLGITQTLMITPKSNIINAGYDQPAQKAPITLRAVLDMLRDCFRCYWFIDGNKFRIEHIQFFRNGGSYSGTPVVGVDLTQQEVTRSGKKWAYARNQYEFNKPETASRYQFGWMDDVTDLFDGYPIDIISKFVSQGNIEQIQVAQFTSDIDYILLNPNDISKDGFVLLAAVLDNGEYVLPYYDYNPDGTDRYLQNGYVAFVMLQEYYAYDMPAPDYEINGVAYVATGTKKLKFQSIRFPALTDPNLLQLVKTFLGDGTIEKLSLNLSSRNANATLKYDTQ